VTIKVLNGFIRTHFLLIFLNFKTNREHILQSGCHVVACGDILYFFKDKIPSLHCGMTVREVYPTFLRIIS